jgi:hypothetical protein
MTQHLSYDHLRRHPFWQVQSVFDPDGEGGDFAYTIGLHDRGFPELHVWARPTLGEDPGLDWMFSPHDRTILLNEFAASLLTGGLEVGAELDQEYDAGLVTVHFRVDPPGDRHQLEALGIAPGAAVLPIRWSLHRAPEGELAPLGAHAIETACVETAATRTQLVESLKPPRGWELPDPPTGAAGFCVDQRYGPLTPLVLTRAAQLWQADDDALAAALDLALLLEPGGYLGYAPSLAMATARPVGRRTHLECLRGDAHGLVDWLTKRPAAGRRWRSIVEDVLPPEGHRSRQDRVCLEEHCAQLLGKFVVGCLLTDAVSDVADRELIETGRGPWLAAFDGHDQVALWAASDVLSAVSRLLRPIGMTDLLAIGVVHDSARQGRTEVDSRYADLATHLTAWAITRAAVCPWELLGELPVWSPLVAGLADEWSLSTTPAIGRVDSLQRWATCLTAALTCPRWLSGEDVDVFSGPFTALLPELPDLLRSFAEQPGDPSPEDA